MLCLRQAGYLEIATQMISRKAIILSKFLTLLQVSFSKDTVSFKSFTPVLLRKSTIGNGVVLCFFLNKIHGLSDKEEVAMESPIAFLDLHHLLTTKRLKKSSIEVQTKDKRQAPKNICMI